MASSTGTIDRKFKYIPHLDLREVRQGRVGGAEGRKKKRERGFWADFLWKHLKWLRWRLASWGCLRINVSASFNKKKNCPSLFPDQENTLLKYTGKLEGRKKENLKVKLCEMGNKAGGTVSMMYTGCPYRGVINKGPPHKPFWRWFM